MIYLDNSATTKPCKEAVEAIHTALCELWGNPSALYGFGFDTAKALRNARQSVAAALGAEPDRVFFTSGGTESNNLAIMGCAAANHRMGKHLITTKIEHPSVGNVMKHMEEEGYEVTYLPVDENGIVKLDKLKEALRPDTMLVSVMHVNNEIGAVQPIEEIAFATRMTCFQPNVISRFARRARFTGNTRFTFGDK